MRAFFKILQSMWNSVLPSRLFALSGTVFLSSPSLQNSPFRSQRIWPFRPPRLGNTLCFGTVALLCTGGDCLLIVCPSVPLHVPVLGAETLSVWWLFHQDQKRPGVPPLGSHWDFPGKNTGVGCHALLLGIFPTQGLNPGLSHCRQILYHLSH